MESFVIVGRFCLLGCLIRKVAKNRWQRGDLLKFLRDVLRAGNNPVVCEI